MATEQEIIEFNRSKIYQKLEKEEQPDNYNGKIPWSVQQQIAATNGRHYINKVGKLNNYPKYELPVSDVIGNKLMLDIGCGWGRWLVAGNEKGYTPIGLDIRLEFCRTARYVLKDQNKTGYAVVGDLENIPFIDNVFDFIWSFSVIQHTHKKRLINCLQCLNNILNNSGYCKLEFPNLNGIRNRRSSEVRRNMQTAGDYNSWDVRYYTPKEYKEIFETYLSKFSFVNHSFLGIGVLKEDLKYVSGLNKLLSFISLTGSGLAKLIPPIKYISDSLYISSRKKELSKDISSMGSINEFFNNVKSNKNDNLNIVPLLKCPKYGGTLIVNKNRTRIESKEAGIYYPVIDDIPILIDSESNPL